MVKEHDVVERGSIIHFMINGHLAHTMREPTGDASFGDGGVRIDGTKRLKSLWALDSVHGMFDRTVEEEPCYGHCYVLPTAPRIPPHKLWRGGGVEALKLKKCDELLR